MPELLLPRLKREIEARLAELRPAVAEAQQLEAARDALLAERDARRVPRRHVPTPLPELDAARASASTARRATTPRPVAEPASPAGASDPLRDTILSLVEERPGVSVAELISVSKLPKGDVASTVSRLKREGLLADEAGGVKLASRKPLTLAQIAAAAARDDGVSDAEWDAARPGPRPKRERARS
jgi:hypothetical protein